LDLRIAHLPAAAIDYLREAMPTTNGDNKTNGMDSAEKEYDYERFIDEVFFT